MTFKQYLLSTVSHNTIAKLVPVTPEQHAAIMEKVAKAIWGRSWR